MWFYYAVLSAIIGAVATVARRTHGSTARPVELAWWTYLIGLPLSLVLVTIVHQPLFTDISFVIPGVASATLCSYAGVLCFSAYKYSDASVVTPLNNLLPIGLLISSFIMFGTKPPTWGLIGILFIVGGVYYSSVSGRHHLLQPLTAIWSNRGSRAMIGTLLLWSVSTNLDKIALRSVSPAFYLLFTQAVIFVLLSMYILVQPKKQQREKVVWHKWWKHIIVISSFTTVAVFFQMKALTLITSSYVFAVKRIDTLIVILIAGLVLREKHILRRIQGAVIALFGVIVIYLVR